MLSFLKTKAFSPKPPKLRSGGFTGKITDSKRRQQCYVEGEHVACGEGTKPAENQAVEKAKEKTKEDFGIETEKPKEEVVQPKAKIPTEIAPSIAEKILKKMGGNAEEINNGKCRQFANKLIKEVGRGSVQTNGGTFNHYWALIDGRLYDAENPEGVDSEDQLNFFKRQAKVMGSQEDWAAKYEAHDKRRKDISGIGTEDKSLQIETKAIEGTCKPGQRADLTGCIPISKDNLPSTKPTPPSVNQEATRKMEQPNAKLKAEAQTIIQSAKAVGKINDDQARHLSSIFRSMDAAAIDSMFEEYVFEVSDVPDERKQKALAWLRQKATTPISGDRSEMETAGVKSNTPLGGGKNETKKIVLEDGTAGVWKPHRGETYDGERKQYLNEVAASQIADLLGMSDLVPTTIKREVEGDGVGSFQKFAPNAENAFVMIGEVDVFDGDEDLARAGALDYLLGNQDRHANNWMVQNTGEETPKLVLIDNGHCFPKFYGQQRGLCHLTEYARKRGLQIPVEVKEWDWGPIEAILKENGLSKEAIRLVEQRLDDLQTYDDFEELKKNSKFKNFVEDEGLKL
jgi:hypothetical protein